MFLSEPFFPHSKMVTKLLIWKYVMKVKQRNVSKRYVKYIVDTQ